MSELTHVRPQDEMQILALIARGDMTFEKIGEKFGVAQSTVSYIKKNNPDTLQILKDQLTNHRISQAATILDKANKAIEKKLDESDSYEDKLAEIDDQWREGVIDDDERNAKLRALQKLTVAELTAISREMHSQTKTDGPDKSPMMNPGDAKEYLIELAKGLEDGDEIALERMIFRKKDA